MKPERLQDGIQVIIVSLLNPIVQILQKRSLPTTLQGIKQLQELLSLGSLKHKIDEEVVVEVVVDEEEVR
ncbi:MAG: hypothetical protein LBD11_02530 [Candidatus Peribacteria bacterium]|jgi:hypothetical protein|nr:hypothetical protein [Candidatus Peribacteria bacterium]